jgi:hypothetical protein
MAILGRLTNLFSRLGRDENRLQLGMEHAHAKRPAEAIAIYDALVNSKGTSPAVRAKALFNRALAHSSLKNDAQAIADLEELVTLVTLASVPENILSAARNQLVRVRNRVQRVTDRSTTSVNARSP